MQPSFGRSRLTGFAILAVAGATALSVGACSSHKSSETPSPSSANGEAKVSGLIASVSGNKVEVTQSAGTATIEVSPSAKINEFTKAKLSDIVDGNCVTVVSKPGSPPEGAVTAASVQVSPQLEDGKCWQPKPSAATQPRQVIGPVASVAGTTINVTVKDANGNPSETHVTVDDTTRYTKTAAVTSQAIVQGKCVNAQGTKDGGGTLQATVVALGPATNGQCPPPDGKK